MTTTTPHPAALDTLAFDRWLSMGLKGQFDLSAVLPGELLSLVDGDAAEPSCN